MTDYSTLGTQVTLAKNKIDALSSTALTAQDLVFLAKALESLGNLLGVNDIIGVTNSSITSVQNAAAGQVNLVTAAGATQIAAVGTTGAQQIALVQAAISNYTLYANMGVL
jgi:hypothetical protein